MVIGFTIFALYIEVKKRMPQAVKSMRLRISGCGLIMQKGNRIAVEWKDWTISTNFFVGMAG